MTTLSASQKTRVRSFLRAAIPIIDASSQAESNDRDMDGSGELGGEIGDFHRSAVAERLMPIAKRLGFDDFQTLWKSLELFAQGDKHPYHGMPTAVAVTYYL